MTKMYDAQLDRLNILDFEKAAIKKIYKLFKTIPLKDPDGRQLVGEPLYLLQAIRSDSTIVDNINDIVYRLNIDLKKHFKFLAEKKPTYFWTVSEWLYSHGWASNEYRKEKPYYRTKWFGVQTAPWQRNMETPNTRKEAEIKLREANREKHERMMALARERRYTNE